MAFCTVCGTEVTGNFCSKCGKSNVESTFGNNSTTYQDPSSAYSSTNYDYARGVNPYYTGYHQPSMYSGPVSQKDKIIALILCIFLGALGLHHFYVGRIGYGILYIFTGGLLGIGWLVDIILIANGTYKDKYGFPLSNFHH